MNLELRVFDLGGTLVDSTWSKIEAFILFAREKGLSKPEAELRAYLETVPVSSVRTSAFLDYFYSLAPDRPRGANDRHEFREIEKGLERRLIPGAVGYLAALQRRGVQVALVTNARKYWIDAVLAASPLGRFFGEDNSFFRLGDEPKKPEPVLYLRAIERFAPDWLVSYEDTPKGIAASRSAGVNAIVGVASSTHHDPEILLQAGAHGVFRDYLTMPLEFRYCEKETAP